MFLASLGPSGVCILILLSGWFLVSIPSQMTNRVGKWCRQFDPYGFVPGWTFFAPTPGTLDYLLVYRDRLQDGTAGPWESVDWCQPRRGLDAVWHPRRYATKLILDSINGLTLIVHAMQKEGLDLSKDMEVLQLSTPYVLLLNVVMGMPRQSELSVARQMALFQRNPMKAREQPGDFAQMGSLMLCSPAHALE